jgi:hypothetical protein
MNWWELMQRIRAEREAAGYPFLDEDQMAQRIDSLREDDDRIGRLREEMEQQRQKQEPS